MAQPPPGTVLSDDPEAGRVLSTDPAAGMVTEPARDWGDTIADLLPTAGGMVGGLIGGAGGTIAGMGVGAIPGGIGGAAAGGVAGESARRLIQGLRGRRNLADDQPLDTLQDLGAAGAVQGISQGVGGLVAKGASALARPAARIALGAQKSVHRKFPTVDLTGVALRSGMPNIERAGQLSAAANKGIGRANRAADAAGSEPISAHEMNRPLRGLFNRYKRAGLSEQADQVSAAMKDAHKRYPSGLDMQGSQILKEEMQMAGRAAQAGAADPRAASTAAKIAKLKGSGIAGSMRQRDPLIGKALDKSQEQMALDMAMKNTAGRTGVLRNLLLGSAVGGGAGLYKEGDAAGGLTGAAIGFGLTSPTVMSAAARALTAGAAPTGKAAQAALAALLSSHEEQ